jgi:hypothetical protein
MYKQALKIVFLKDSGGVTVPTGSGSFDRHLKVENSEARRMHGREAMEPAEVGNVHRKDMPDAVDIHRRRQSRIVHLNA